MYQYIVLSFFAVWLLAVSVILYKMRSHYHKLTTRTKNYSIDEILEALIKDDENVKKEVARIKKELEETTTKSEGHIQKIGVVRFDPYGKKGEGSSSFVLSMLDSKDSGVVLTFLYTHEGVRVYAKKIKEGRGEEYELSQEEKKSD